MEKSMIKLFDQNNINDLDETEIAEGKDWIEYLKQLVQRSPSYYIRNFNCDFLLVQLNDKLVPIALNHCVAKSSHMTSLYSYYLIFGVDSLTHKIESNLLTLIIRGCAKFFSTMLGLRRIDRTIIVGSWMLPTPPRLTIRKNEFIELNNFFTKNYPKHAFVYRGYNNYFNIYETEQFKITEENFLLSKIYYLIDDVSKALKKKDVKRSLKTLNNKIFHTTGKDGLSDDDFNRVLNLYEDLYIKKFSTESILYNVQWFKLFITQPAVEIMVVRDELHSIQSFIICFKDGDYVISSIGAFNLLSPERLQLYIMNFANRFKYSHEVGKKLNLSSGGDQFKRNRGGVEHYEYDLVYYKHLHPLSRIRWKLFTFLYRRIAVKIFQNLVEK